MSAPVRHTCPNIDKVLKSLSAARGALKEALQCNDEEDIKYAIKVADDELSGLDWDIESLRTDNALLRDWGHDLEKRIDELEEEVSELLIDTN